MAWEETNILVEFPATASVLASAEAATVVHPKFGKVPRDAHVKPESAEMKMLPRLTTAARMEPSAEEATALHDVEPGALVAVQFKPELAET